MTLCACGCGEKTKLYRGRPNKFINGHQNKGETHPNWGKDLSEKTRDKISESKMGVKNPNFGKPAWNKGKKYKLKNYNRDGENNSNWKGGKPSCPICGKKLSHRESVFCVKHRNFKGRNNPNWKDGISAISHLIRTSEKYLNWRNEILTRDNFTCQECCLKENLEVHHEKEFYLILKNNNIKMIEDALACEELWNLNNGKTLCLNCHNKIKRRNNMQNKGIPKKPPTAESGVNTKESKLRPDSYGKQIADQVQRIDLKSDGTMDLKPGPKGKVRKDLVGV